MGKVYILPYLRKGLASYIDKNTDIKGKKRAEIRVDLNMKVSTANNADESYDKEETVKGKSIELLGPADIKMLSRNAIIRVSPAETGDVRINCKYCPFIEFYEEDLPWRYTPLEAEHPDFHPWLTLIAVKEDEMKVYMQGSIKVVELNLTAERYTEVFPTLKVLKDVGHVQIDTDDDRIENNNDTSQTESLVNEILNDNPNCGKSRILCPSKLEPDTVYNILLIPSYELGRLAALGLGIDFADLNTCAWEPTLEEQMKRPNGMAFPLYKKWKITTAFAADNFITLAKKLFHTSEKEYDEMNAYLDVDITHSGLASANVKPENAVIDVPASLIFNDKPTNLREEDDDYRQALMETLLLNPVFNENDSGKIDMESDPWVVPPVYGARHQLKKRLEFEHNTINFNEECDNRCYDIVKDVNLRLRNRIVAGLGAQIVKKNQEEFMNRAWKKVEVVNTVNQIVREYYQMKQVNECSKERSPRMEIFNQKANITEKAAGLLSDAALKMLQSSGIYYNSVAPDKMLEAANTDMNKQENPISKNGLPREFLLKLYDQDLWIGERRKKFILENLKSTTGKDKRISDCAFQAFAEYAFLDNYLCVKWEKDRAYFSPIVNDGEEAEMFEDVSSNYHPLTADYRIFIDLLNDVSRYGYQKFDFSSIYKTLARFKVKNVFNDSVKAFGSINVRPINMRMGNNFAYTYILSDDTILRSKISKSIAIEFEYNGGKYYIYFLTEKHFEEIKNKMRHNFFIGYKSDSISTYDMGGYFSASCDTINDIISYYEAGHTIEEQSVKAISLYHYDTFINRLKSQTNRTLSYLIDIGKQSYRTDNKTDKQYTDKDYPYVQIRRNRDNTIDISFKGWEHIDQNWNYNDALNKEIISISNGYLYFHFDKYIVILKDLLKRLFDFEFSINQPTYVQFVYSPSFSLDEFDIIKAEDLVNKVFENENDVDFVSDKLLSKIKSEYDNIQKMFADGKTPAAKIEEEEKTIDIGIPNPDQFARDRIEEIAQKYGITEMLQLNTYSHRYPVMVYPDFLDPTFFYLRELSVNYVLPGTGELLKNTISCFYSNPAFEEALLMGMNTEMAHELLWREYPTDQRGSYFRKFWDQSELPTKDNLSLYFDVMPLDCWDRQLGENRNEGKYQMLVFAIKGELMQVFPDTKIYLREKSTGIALESCMSSWLTEDTYLVGFPGIKKEGLSQYYLVFEQMPLSLQFDQKDGTPINSTFNVVRPCIFAIPAGPKPQ